MNKDTEDKIEKMIIKISLFSLVLAIMTFFINLFSWDWSSYSDDEDISW